MRKRLLICAAATVVFSVAVACTAFSGPPYAAYGEVHDSMTVSGVWTSVDWYESDGCYSGTGDPVVSDFKSQAQGSSPVGLSTAKSDTYGSASSVLKVWAPSLVPTIP